MSADKNIDDLLDELIQFKSSVNRAWNVCPADCSVRIGNVMKLLEVIHDELDDMSDSFRKLEG